MSVQLLGPRRKSTPDLSRMVAIKETAVIADNQSKHPNLFHAHQKGEGHGVSIEAARADQRVIQYRTFVQPKRRLGFGSCAP